MRSSTRRNRGHVQWVRANAYVNDAPVVGADYVMRADLFAPARAVYGPDYLRDATVLAVKGYVKPILTSVNTTSVDVSGVSALRLMDQAQADSPPEFEETPGSATSASQRWELYQPWAQVGRQGAPTDTPGEQITSNMGASPWAVDVRSKIRMESSSKTVVLYVQQFGQNSTMNVLYHLSLLCRWP